MPDDTTDLTPDELAALEREHDALVCRLRALAWEYLQRSGRAPMGPRPEAEVALRLGLTRHKVRKIERRALAVLRKHLTTTSNPQP